MLVTLLVGVIALVALLALLPKEDAGGDGLSVTADVAKPPVQEAQPLVEEELQDNGGERSGNEWPDLTVTITDQDGKDLGNARLVGCGPLGAEEEPDFETNDLPDADEAGVFVGLSPGRWVLRAEAPLHFPQEHVLELGVGESVDVVLVLRPAAVVQGRVTNAFGSAFGNGWIWFLPPDRKHPDVPRTAEGLVKARVDAEGHFESPLLRPGKYRLSFGPMGRIHLQDTDARRLAGATRYVVDGNVMYRSQVIVEVVGMAPREKRKMEVSLMQRRVKDRYWEEEDSLRRRHPEDELEPDKKEKKEKWESRSERRLGDGDRVLFTRLDPDSYRVAFKLGSKHFISDQEVSLDEGSAVVVIATVNELAAGDKREPGALPIDVVEMLPDLSLGGPGFHWK